MKPYFDLPAYRGIMFSYEMSYDTVITNILISKIIDHRLTIKSLTSYIKDSCSVLYFFGKFCEVH